MLILLLAHLLFLLAMITVLLGTIGILRFPELSSRLQVLVKSFSLALLFVLLGVALLQPLWWGKLLLLALLLLLFFPIGISQLAQRAQSNKDH